MFISLTTTYLLLVLAKRGAALSPLFLIAGYVAIIGGVATWYVAVAHVTNATFSRDLVLRGHWPNHLRGTAAYDEGTE